MKILVRLVLVFVFCVISGVSYAFYYLSNNLTPVSSNDKKTMLFHVTQGMPLTSALKKLESNKLIKDYKAARLYTLIYGGGRSIKPGYYQVSRSMSFEEIFQKLDSGKVFQLWLTIPEGFSIKKIAKRLDKNNLSGDSYKNLVYSIPESYRAKYEFLSEIPSDQSLEGYLFPDTYDITAAQEEDIIKQQLNRFNETIYQAWQNRPSDWKMSLHETVTLASIVELEAQKPSERGTIAGVFVNRLHQGIPLGSDPTVEYALGWHQDAKGLTFNDVKVRSPYNTYINRGLPPGPIANAGLAAFKAVLNYEHTPYLYFVAKGDGSHVFTKSYPEHLRAQSLIIKGLLK